MEQIRMVVTDLDGTWLRGDKTVSEYAEWVAERLRARGILFVVATARPIRAVDRWLPQVRYDAGVFHNGAVVADQSGPIAHFGIARPRQLIAAMLAERPGCRVAAEADDWLHANFDAGEIWPGIEHTRTGDFAGIERSIADKLILQADTPQDMMNFARYLPDELYLQLSENTIAMVMHRDATKMRGIRLLAEREGIAIEQIVAFGDDLNDAEMLAGCGVGVAMANALPEVRRAADEVCPGNDQDGVARWLADRLGL
ncbi:MAG: HAD family hydrolase [Clostridiales bacterium]|nr:HAD family hydrolase [Clostridiales bacterium]